MLYLNDQIKNNGLKAKLIELTMPNIYYASSIQDFENHKSEVEPKKGFASVLSSLAFSEMNNPVLIRMANITFYGYDKRQEIISLKDHTNYLNVCPLNKRKFEKEIINQDVRYADELQSVYLCYYPQTNNSIENCFLARFDKLIKKPISKEEKEKSFWLLDSLLVPQN